MSDASGHPTRDELLVMAYVDDELAAEQRAELEARLAREPALVSQVAAYRKLEVLARQVAPPEPADHEWQRLRAEPIRRAGVGLGWLAFGAGSLALGVWALVAVLGSDATPVQKALIVTPIAGLLLLVLLRLRDRLRLIPFDPYTEVQR